ncbi:uncharacterized protein LOC119690110 [Teleopsis dalmanni]|uniref:uncharacterized protein LOC119690090 n=1 Tax=Teleopsis dalmanni TaxID=139649 RepID=UPI0018CEC2FB|nr:uncharacterized protein LOC119690090 [Teleopsis dalmanni]XP_037961028.1 uncharacterized protein LOC119690110 [Teleopsis dalmanni]
MYVSNLADPFCRVCRDGDPYTVHDELLMPCECTEETQFVHKLCLLKCERLKCDDEKGYCEFCGANYITTQTEKSLFLVKFEKVTHYLVELYTFLIQVMAVCNFLSMVSVIALALQRREELQFTTRKMLLWFAKIIVVYLELGSYENMLGLALYKLKFIREKMPTVEKYLFIYNIFKGGHMRNVIYVLKESLINLNIGILFIIFFTTPLTQYAGSLFFSEYNDFFKLLAGVAFYNTLKTIYFFSLKYLQVQYILKAKYEIYI